MDPERERVNFEIVNPDPAALIESLRAFGYTPESAIADLVDNSITARSKNLRIGFDWRGSNSRITIRDDGAGMTSAALVQAMRPGSTSPSQPRNKNDLGRFGLGLKTASFSQCRALSVITKTTSGTISARRWDLDEVVASHEWRLLRDLGDDNKDMIAELDGQAQGTIVIWQVLDRLVGTADVEDDAAQRHFLALAQSIREHLAMTFHRFLSHRSGVSLFVNDREVPAWDPFLSGNTSRQVLAVEELPLANSLVTVRPVVLPHRAKLTTEDFDLAGGRRGWNSLQGFYVYRNKRLLVAGDWLGLGFQKEEHYKLARIQVDIGNDMDTLWQIDVRKSMARPPAALRDELRRIAKVTRARAVEVYRHRGKVLVNRSEKGLIPMWQQRVRHGKITYEINRDHPVVKDAIGNPSAATIRTLVQVAEETVPIPLISIANAEHSHDHATPFEGANTKNVADIALAVYDSFRQRGIDHAAARQRVLSTDPFQYFPELVEVIDKHAVGDHS